MFPRPGALLPGFVRPTMPRYGAVAYLNARPLVEGLAPLTLDTPARLVERFSAGALDVALLPVAAAEATGLQRVGSLGVSADGPVESVLLFLRCPVEEVETLFLDPSSRTSRLLARLVLGQAYGRPVREIAARKDADAELVIGDPALCRAQDPGARLDLAQEWRRWTGLPFVFAAWYASPRLSPGQALRIETELEAAWKRGVERLDEFVAEAHRDLGVPRERLEVYLRERIRYRLGEAERQGLARFLASARAAGLFDEGGTPAPLL